MTTAKELTNVQLSEKAKELLNEIDQRVSSGELGEFDFCGSHGSILWSSSWGDSWESSSMSCWE